MPDDLFLSISAIYLSDHQNRTVFYSEKRSCYLVNVNLKKTSIFTLGDEKYEKNEKGIRPNIP